MLPDQSERNQHNKRKNILKSIVIIFAAIFGTTALILWYFWQEPILSPLSSITTFQFLRTQENLDKPKKIVYGFLPYWNINSAAIQPELTQLAYFSLTIGPDGFIKTKDDQGNTDPGYAKLSSDRFLELAREVDQNKGKFEIVLTQFSNDDIESFANNPEAHQNLLTSLDSILLAYPISGVNIDIEHTGEVTPKLRQNFASMIRTVNQHLDQKYNHVQLSIDVYASAASRNLIWDIPAIAQEVDYIIIMAYDFHRRSSTQAGPVAPLFGGGEFWDSDINQHLKKFFTQAPRSKLILGIPFYGYGWRTTSQESQALTYPDSGSTATYLEVQELLAQKTELGITENWHEAALSPYLTYRENEENIVIYYEDIRSIAYKLDYVNQLDLPGIAIWALGYEGEARELWNVVSEKFDQTTLVASSSAQKRN
ncbi:MAG: glycosyl hydrolase family 18 protein [Patescibacteria group bacterium]